MESQEGIARSDSCFFITDERLMISEGALLTLHTSGVRRVIAAAEPPALEEPPVDAAARVTRQDG